MVLLVVIICNFVWGGVFCYLLYLRSQEQQMWLRLHSASLNISSLTIDKPQPEVAVPAAQPRRVHKLSVPMPLGGLNREQVSAVLHTTGDRPATAHK